MLIYYAELRIGEVCGLKWCDVDLGKGVLKVERTLQRIYENGSTMVIVGSPKSKSSVRTTPLPPLSELFAICDYFGITPSEFFDQDSKHPELTQKTLDGSNQLNDADLLMVLGHQPTYESVKNPVCHPHHTGHPPKFCVTAK